MATNGGEEETVRKLIEKQLDEKETTNQVMKRLQDELAKIKSEAEEIELIEETKCQDELEKLKGELEKVTPLKDNNYFDDNISNYIEHYSNQFSSYPKLNEEEIQKGFDQLIVNLLNTSNNSTSLKYLNTSSSYYLENKFNPNCTFIYKNINIDMDQEKSCLQHFVVCL
ncbi:unnamed protein product, partial [Rotaria socialis]